MYYERGILLATPRHSQTGTFHFKEMGITVCYKTAMTRLTTTLAMHMATQEANSITSLFTTCQHCDGYYELFLRSTPAQFVACGFLVFGAGITHYASLGQRLIKPLIEEGPSVKSAFSSVDLICVSLTMTKFCMPTFITLPCKKM